MHMPTGSSLKCPLFLTDLNQKCKSSTIFRKIFQQEISCESVQGLKSCIRTNGHKKRF